MESSENKSTSNKEKDLYDSLNENVKAKPETESQGTIREVLFSLPSTDGSPPKVMTINEVADVVKNIQNMTLAHEIAVNPEFKLQSYNPPENSLITFRPPNEEEKFEKVRLFSLKEDGRQLLIECRNFILEKRIKEVMHQAFWDVLREQLNTQPPCFDHAIQLLIDIKECFPQIIPASNQRILDHINDVLDVNIIKQQAEHGTLDFRSYANFVIEIMAKSCAPVRDEEIQSLSRTEDVVNIFKGILETMSLMKLDMANCLLEFARNDLLVNSVEYEKQKFKEYLEYYKFGFPATENWLRRNQINDLDGKKTNHDVTIFNAYLELLDWNEDFEYPEILATDKERLYKLSFRAIKLCICASVTAICTANPIFSKYLNQIVNSHSLLSSQILIILENINNRNDVIKSMENIWLQVYSVLRNYCEEQNCEFLDESSEKLLRDQILRTADKEFSVYKLMWKRLQAYVRIVLNTKTGLPCSPPGYIEVQEELQNFANGFKRLLKYNYAVYGSYYIQILSNADAEN